MQRLHRELRLAALLECERQVVASERRDVIGIELDAFTQRLDRAIVVARVQPGQATRRARLHEFLPARASQPRRFAQLGGGRAKPARIIEVTRETIEREADAVVLAGRCAAGDRDRQPVIERVRPQPRVLPVVGLAQHVRPDVLEQLADGHDAVSRLPGDPVGGAPHAFEQIVREHSVTVAQRPCSSDDSPACAAVISAIPAFASLADWR